MFDRFDGLLAQKHLVLQGHEITHHSPTITRPSYNLGLKLANGIYTWLQADLLKMKKI